MAKNNKNKKNRCRIPKALGWIVLLYAITKAKNIARAEEMSPDHAAAACIAKNDNCTPEIANQSSSCKPNTFVKAQDHGCLMAACLFCRRTNNQALSICSSSWAIKNWCSKISLPPMSPTPSSTTTTAVSATSSATASASSQAATSSPSVEIPSPSGPPQSSPSPSPTQTTTQTYTPDQAAAICIGNGEKCDEETSSYTKFCKAKTFVKKQHPNCLKAACLFCRRSSNVDVPVCDAWSIRHWCSKVTLESMTPSASLSSASISQSGLPSLAAHSVTTTSSSSSSAPVTTSPPALTVSSSTPTATALPSLGGYLGPDHAAAECFALGRTCPWKIANESEVCKPNTFPRQQPDLCLKKACHFCGRSQNRDIKLCESWAIKHWCKLAITKLETSSASPKVSKPISPYPSCVYPEENGTVVISLSSMKPQGMWTKTTDGKGIVWREGNNRTSVDSWQSTASSQYCFNVLINKEGTYYITAHTSAPHWSEHNDMWLRCSAKIDLYDAKTHKKKMTRAAKDRFLKAYQNFGHNRIADIISSVNHDPHIFVTMPIKSRTIIKLCIAGRSSKFKVYDLVMIHCVGEDCKRSSQHIRNIVRSLKYTNCRSDYL